MPITSCQTPGHGHKCQEAAVSLGTVPMAPSSTDAYKFFPRSLKFTPSVAVAFSLLDPHFLDSSLTIILYHTRRQLTHPKYLVLMSAHNTNGTFPGQGSKQVRECLQMTPFIHTNANFPRLYTQVAMQDLPHGFRPPTRTRQTYTTNSPSVLGILSVFARLRMERMSCR